MTLKQSVARWMDKTRAAFPGPETPESAPANLAGDPGMVSPWKFSAGQAGFLAGCVLTAGVVLFLRFFRLDSLQTEVYPDIDIVRDFVRQVLVGGWPVQFNLSAGPLYEYLISPVIMITGLNYLGLKIASVLVSLVCLGATYAFSRRLFNDYFALLVVFIAGVSSWLLIFSRLGNLLIFLPVLTMLALWLVMRILQFGRLRDVAACALVAGLGLFVYPQSYILPGVIFVTLLCLRWSGRPLPRGWIQVFVGVSVVFLVLFALVVTSDMANFTSGYVGNKIDPPAGQSALSVLAGNAVNALLALHVRGDGNFRSNPVDMPHLDWISGLLFLGGLVFWSVSAERRRWIPVWLVPLILLEVPSMLALNQPAEVPSASRTLGVAPIIYMLVASGLWWLARAYLVRGGRWRWAGLLVGGLLLASMLSLNAQRYFQAYMDGLPYQGTPIGQSIASYANTLPANTQVYMVGCCWEAGMPEYFVRYDMTQPEDMQYVNAPDLSCARLQSVTLPAVFIWSFHDSLPAPQLEACKQWFVPQEYDYQGKPVFNAAALHPDSAPAPTPTLNSNSPEADLEHGQVQLDGQPVRVDYSPIDIGSIGDLFDGNTNSLIRGKSANPLVVVLRFTQPRAGGALDLDLGSIPRFHITLVVTYADNSSQSVQKDYQGLPADPQISIALPPNSQLISQLRIMLQNMDPAPDADGYHIHLREVRLH